MVITIFVSQSIAQHPPCGSTNNLLHSLVVLQSKVEVVTQTFFFLRNTFLHNYTLERFVHRQGLRNTLHCNADDMETTLIMFHP